ncbi:MAG: amino acid permease, partial [Candidatus Marsarchaeota archaeon]|nr:amino acid permease [Candidatus Marsarchaeota archaeon]
MSSVTRAFVRKSSGLVRSFSILDVIVINVACVAMGWTVIVIGFLAASLWPGSNIGLSMLIGAVPAVFMGLVYGLFSAAMPRSGGDYVFVSRILHPALGFTINWGITWSLFLGVAMYSATLISWTIVPTFATMGLATGNNGLVSLSESINTPGWTFLAGALAIGLIAAVMLLGTKFIRNAFRVLLAIAMLGLVLTMVLLFTTSQSEFAASFNAFLAAFNNNPDTYGTILKQAGDAGWTPVAFSLGATLLSLPLGYWMYLGTTYSAYASGEVKEPSRSQPFGIIIAMAVALIFTAGIVQLAYGTLGWDFVQAIGFLQANGAQIPLPGAAMLPFFLGTINSNPVIIAFV